MPIMKYMRDGLERRAKEMRDPNRLKIDLFEFGFTVVVGLALVLAGAGIRYLASESSPGSSGQTVQQRAEQLSRSLTDATQLIDQMQGEIISRQAMVTKLQTDLETYNKLAELKRNEVEAVAQVLRGELDRGPRRSFWQSALVNFASFVGGSLVTWLVGWWFARRRGSAILLEQ